MGVNVSFSNSIEYVMISNCNMCEWENIQVWVLYYAVFCEKILRLQDDKEFEGIVFELSQNKFDTNFTDWMKTKVWGRQLEKIFR